jgi:hypothetical protein
VKGWWFSPGTPVSSTKRTDRHDINANIAESGVKHHKPNQHSVIVSTLTLFIICNCYLNLQFLNNVVVFKIKDILPQA